MKEEKTEPF